MIRRPRGTPREHREGHATGRLDVTSTLLLSYSLGDMQHDVSASHEKQPSISLPLGAARGRGVPALPALRNTQMGERTCVAAYTLANKFRASSSSQLSGYRYHDHSRHDSAIIPYQTAAVAYYRSHRGSHSCAATCVGLLRKKCGAQNCGVPAQGRRPVTLPAYISADPFSKR